MVGDLALDPFHAWVQQGWDSVQAKSGEEKDCDAGVGLYT